MKLIDIIRLGIIAIALLLGYYGIMNVIELLGLFATNESVGDDKNSMYLLLKAIGFLAASFILIKTNRKIANFIEGQK
jgi:hypothetical protein